MIHGFQLTTKQKLPAPVRRAILIEREAWPAEPEEDAVEPAMAARQVILTIPMDSATVTGDSTTDKFRVRASHCDTVLTRVRTRSNLIDENLGNPRLLASRWGGEVKSNRRRREAVVDRYFLSLISLEVYPWDMPLFYWQVVPKWNYKIYNLGEKGFLRQHF